MTYIDFMKQVCRLAFTESMQASDLAIYTLLVDECNHGFWKMPFQCPTIKVCEALRISKQTFCSARERLAGLGLISFNKGKSKHSPSIYTLLNLTENLTLASLTYSNSINTKDKDDCKKEGSHKVSWAEKKNALLSDSTWQVNAKSYLENYQGDTKELLGRFLDYLELSNDTQKSIDEMRKHFLNWAMQKAKSPKKSDTQPIDDSLILKNNSQEKYSELKKRLNHDN